METSTDSIIGEDTMELSEDTIVSLKQFNIVWLVFNNDFLYNPLPLDTRTAEWRRFLSWLVCSSMQESSAGIMIFLQPPTDPADAPPKRVYSKKPRKKDAISAILNSLWCQPISDQPFTFFKTRVTPIREALPFIVQLYTNPTKGFEEARYPPGCYIRTINVSFKKWNIEIDAFRDPEDAL